MRLRRWQVEIAVTLIVAAIVVYALRWYLFIQVLLVSMLIDGLMQRRQRETVLDKLNMIIGAWTI